MVDLIKHVEENIKKYECITKGSHVGVAVSGGADSMCLLSIFISLKEKIGFTLTVLHVEHGIRGDASKEDANFVRDYCYENEIPFILGVVNIPEIAKEKKLSEEVAARQARYNFFEQEAKARSIDVVALAHHLDDQAETLILNLVRGTGMSGLTGMRMFREPFYIRPILDVSKDAVLEYLERNNIPFRQDETNSQLAYSRNRIRHKVLPELEIINQEACLNIAKTADLLRDENRFIDTLVFDVYQQFVKVNSDEVRIVLDDWYNWDVVIQRRLIRMVMEKCFSLVDVEFIHIVGIINIANAENGKRISLSNGLIAAKTYHTLTIYRSFKDNDHPPILINVKDKDEITYGGYQFHTSVIGQAYFKDESECFDLDKLMLPMLRMPQPDDFIVPLGMKGRKKLTDYFSDCKIPLHKRKTMVVMAQDNEVIWVVGYAISENVKVDKTTSQVFHIRYEKNN